MAIKILTDSTAYLSKTILDTLDISVVSLNVIYDGQSYSEVDADFTRFYEKLSTMSKLPTSSQPSTEDFYNTMKKHVQEGHEVLGIFLSSSMSGTFSTAQLVKNMILEEMPQAKIELIDSKTNCMEMGFVVMAAAKAAQQGLSMTEIITNTYDKMKCTRFVFMPKTLEYLKKGGRIGNASSLIAEILKIKPVLTVEEGVTTTRSKIRTRQKALEYMKQLFLQDIKTYGFDAVAIHHIDCEAEAYQFSKDLELPSDTEITLVAIGPVIGLHVGPGTIGLAYSTKKPLR